MVNIDSKPPEYEGYIEWNSKTKHVKKKIVDPFTRYEISRNENRRLNRGHPYGIFYANMSCDGESPRYNLVDGWWSTGLYHVFQFSHILSHRGIVKGRYFRT